MRQNSSIFILVVSSLFFIGCNDLATGPESPASSDPEPTNSNLEIEAKGAFSGEGQAAKNVKIDFDAVVEAGEIPPPEKPLFENEPAPRREAAKLQRTCRYIHGTLGSDARFQICLPVEGWNGKLAVWAPGGAGSEVRGSLTFRPAALDQGYAFASTNLGFNPLTLTESENRAYEGERRTLQLTQYAKSRATTNYDGRRAERIYLAGWSYGAYITTRLLEEHPGVYDGGIRYSGANWIYQTLRAYAIWLRNWDERPVDPIMYDVGAELPRGGAYRLGQERGTETLWKNAVPIWTRFLTAGVSGIDPTYDPNGDGTVSPSEAIAWNADERPRQVRSRLKKTAVTGRLDTKMIAFSGLKDMVIPPSADRTYKRLVEEGKGGGEVALYLKPGVGHYHDFPAPLDGSGAPKGFYPEALQDLDRWVEEDIAPGTIDGLSPE